MAKRRKRPPLDMSKINDSDKDWFDKYNNEFAPKFGWPKLPIQIGYWSYMQMRKLVADWQESWPTWEELEAGLEATAGWQDGSTMSVNQPFWIVQAKQVEDADARYPNILLLRNFALEAKQTKSPGLPTYGGD